MTILARTDGEIRYVVAVQGGAAPKVQHKTKEKAMREARRLCRKGTEPVRVMAVVGAVFPCQNKTKLTVADFEEKRWVVEQQKAITA